MHDVCLVHLDQTRVIAVSLMSSPGSVGIMMEPYSPLGSPGTFDDSTPNPLEDGVIKDIALKHKATPAHVRYIYIGQCKRKLGVCNFFQVFKFNIFWIQDSALYKTVLTHPKLDSVS